MVATDDPSLPNLVVIGGAKTGTSSLHTYLGLHPQIFMSRVKELRFFAENYERGLEWYRAQFQGGRDHPIRGETSPQYTAHPYPKGVPARMHALIPDAKLLYVVRDPFARLLSHFVFMAAEEQLSDLNQALVPLDTNPYVASSRQAWQLEQYLAYYPLSQMLVVEADDLRRRRRATLAQIFRFLGVDDTFDSADFDAELNVTSVVRRHRGPLNRLIHTVVGWRPGRFLRPRLGLPLRNRALLLFSRPVARPVMDPAIEQRLRELFADDAARLRGLTGLRLDHWSV